MILKFITAWLSEAPAFVAGVQKAWARSFHPKPLPAQYRVCLFVVCFLCPVSAREKLYRPLCVPRIEWDVLQKCMQLDTSHVLPASGAGDIGLEQESEPPPQAVEAKKSQPSRAVDAAMGTVSTVQGLVKSSKLRPRCVPNAENRCRCTTCHRRTRRRREIS